MSGATTFTYTNTDSADPPSAAATGTVRTIVTSADGGAQGAVTEFLVVLLQMLITQT